PQGPAGAGEEGAGGADPARDRAPADPDYRPAGGPARRPAPGAGPGGQPRHGGGAQAQGGADGGDQGADGRPAERVADDRGGGVRTRFSAGDYSVQGWTSRGPPCTGMRGRGAGGAAAGLWCSGTRVQGIESWLT